MPDSNARVESMLFDYATTYRTDYQNREMQAPILTTFKKKERSMTIKKSLPVRGIHTLSDWKASATPFDLLLKEKDIVRTIPTAVQKRYEKSTDEDGGRAEAQKTRPRLVMTPAVSLDDVTDARARTILCEDMYTSEMTSRLREAVSPYFSVKAPMPGLPANANPIVLPKLQLPVVSPEWRMESVSWDRDQLREYCDPTKEFWLKQKLYECRACDETKAVEAHRKMTRQTRASRR